MDVLKAAGRVGSAGRHVVAAAVQQKQLETEREVLAELRSDALTLRAQIGEEMFKLWKAGQPCPRWLDEICQSLESTSAAIARQRAIIAQLVEGGVPAGDNETHQTVTAPAIEVVEAPATLLEAEPASPPRITAGTIPQPDPPCVTCPSCGEAEVGGRRFCGFCGTKLS